MAVRGATFALPALRSAYLATEMMDIVQHESSDLFLKLTLIVRGKAQRSAK
jgi:hypothetical protein